MFACAGAYVYRSEDSAGESVLSFYIAEPRYRTQVARLSSKHLYPLSHIGGPLPPALCGTPAAGRSLPPLPYLYTSCSLGCCFSPEHFHQCVIYASH